MRDGAHTHHSNGPGGLGLAVSIAAGLVLADVTRTILPVLLIGVAVAAGLAVLSLIARAVTTSSCRHEVRLTSRDGCQSLEAADDEQTRVVATPITRAGLPERHQHLHFHGLDPGQVAAILAALQEQAANREDDAR